MKGEIWKIIAYILALSIRLQMGMLMLSLEGWNFSINSLEKFGSRVEIIGFTELLIDFAKTHQISTVIRGLRAVSDFEYELQIGYANAALWAEFETVYLMPTLKNAFISSSIVRGIFGHGGDVTHLVPPQVTQFLREKYEYKF